ncbi:unnamed protein product [Menidia menidia]|uniref:(Atlantic silverside) hypothetical protein n=1 Tax=Menidia menidia TaxID=238744 RepID=A0A8S4B635_9TELE|nr:unnamed protein product [Menidia menidia]
MCGNMASNRPVKGSAGNGGHGFLPPLNKLPPTSSSDDRLSLSGDGGAEIRALAHLLLHHQPPSSSSSSSSPPPPYLPPSLNLTITADRHLQPFYAGASPAVSRGSHLGRAEAAARACRRSRTGSR